MNFKHIPEKTWSGLKHIWNRRYLQRTARITYDIVANLLLFFLVIGAMIALFGAGVGAGYFASLVKDEPIRKYEDMRDDIYNYEETSRFYFAGNIYLGDIRSELHREEIPLEDIPKVSIDALLSTEDQEFYEHNGVVPKAVVRALLQDITNSATKSGGSTITQQLIKNQILTDEVSFDRKAKEMLLAMRLERFFEKDEILEAYLNIVPYGRNSSGRNIAGIQMAAQGIFDVDAKDLTLPQAAFIAGLPQNPYTFTPFKTNGELKSKKRLQPGIERMKVVLKRMYQNNKISEKEYNKAIKYDIVADFTEKKESALDRYPSIVFELEKQAKKVIKNIIAEEDGYELVDLAELEKLVQQEEATEAELTSAKEIDEQYELLADRALRMNGYNIHSTIDKDIYDTMQKTAQNFQHYGPAKSIIVKDEDGEDMQVMAPVQVGASLIENNTGRVLGFIPGREDSLKNQYNHATQAYRSPGSTIKPLLVYGPGFELGAFQPGSIVADVPLGLGITTPSGKDWPSNVNNKYNGLVSTREALTHSHNVSTVSLYRQILNENPARNFLMKMGFDKITPQHEVNLSLATGSTEMTVEQNTNAFATFSNEGQFIESQWIDKITTQDGTVIYELEVEPVTVFSPESAYLTIDVMRDVMKQGTGTYVKANLNNKQVDWVGKTGTSDNHHDLWFVGTNPNVTLGTWMGYDDPSSIECRGCSLPYYQRNQLIWTQIINDLTAAKPDIMAPSEKFKQPSSIVTRSYCATSGMVPSKICEDAGLVRSDIYDINFLPKDEDDSLIGGNMPLVVIDGETVTAGPDTPSEFTSESTGGFSFNPSFLKRMKYDKLKDLSMLIPRLRAEKGWSNISFDGVSTGNDDPDDEKTTQPAKPTKLKHKDDSIVWKGAQKELIVGYRIYRAEDVDEAFELLDHTLETTYEVPDLPGVYHIRAVNYYGVESDPSAEFVIQAEADEDDAENDNNDSTDDENLPERDEVDSD